MSKKHFEAIASILASVKPDKRGVRLQQWERDVKAMATVCGQFNRQFDRDRFLMACGLQER